jgi:hypothetical protein
MTTSRPSALPNLYPLLAVAATALAVEIPFLYFGFPSGHDVEFHLYSWLEVLGQWKQGILYPRWASLAHFAYGEPRFIFYPPASWTLGALLSATFPWTAVSCLYIWIALTAAGVSMHALARRWLNRRDALFAACLYAANPYHLLIVYWRSAFAELLAAWILPLLLLLLLQAADKKDRDHWRMIPPLSLLLAAAWLTNAPAAVMIHYSFALLVVVLAWQHRSWRLLAVGAGAVIAGACVPAFYLLPATYEQRWVHIDQAISQGLRPQVNFLFAHTTDLDHDAFNRLVSWIALAEMFVTFATLAAVTQRRKSRSVNDKDFLYVLTAWAAASSFLMLSPSSFLWAHLPKLQFMQLPWRWLLCLSMTFALAVTIGLRQWWARAIACLILLLVLGAGWIHVQTPWWDQVDDLREIQDNMAIGTGYEGVDEYTPIAANHRVIDKEARRVTVVGPTKATIHVLFWNAEAKMFTADLSAPANVAVRLFNYPAWRVEDNGEVVQTAAEKISGQMLVPLAAGPNRVQISFIRTWDRKVGGWISAIALPGFVLWMFFARKSSQTSGNT